MVSSSAGAQQFVQEFRWYSVIDSFRFITAFPTGCDGSRCGNEPHPPHTQPLLALCP
eukprot:COSAG06_NODE_71_length_25945_cov_9.124468_17_plen_57_part_00